MTAQKAIEGCKRGDRISQKFIFDEYSEGMLIICLRYVKSLHDAEELMQNGFFQFFRSIDRFQFNGENSIGGWMKKIMVNECLMFLRKNVGLNICNDEIATGPMVNDGPLSRLGANEILQLVLALPVGYRTVFNLFVVEGYSHKEIAAMLNIAVGTSKSQLNKARAMLRQALEKKETFYEK